MPLQKLLIAPTPPLIFAVCAPPSTFDGRQRMGFALSEGSVLLYVCMYPLSIPQRRDDCCRP